MLQPRFGHVLCLLCALLLAGCGGEEEGTETTTSSDATTTGGVASGGAMDASANDMGGNSGDAMDVSSDTVSDVPVPDDMTSDTIRDTTVDMVDDTTQMMDMPDMPDMPDPLIWPINDGRFGTPTITFTLPAPNNPGSGLYHPDIQASFPDVDWANLERLYIPAGHYPFIRIGNLPNRSANAPLVITNKDGQVRIGGLDHYYLFAIGGGSNWVLTGRFDPVSQTGDAGFPGHRGGAFANSQDTYGILIDDDFLREGNSGIGVGSGASDFEIEYVEVREVGFAAMTLKTDDDGAAVMANVRLHDNYLHDIGSEGLYVGSTQSQPQHQIRDWHIYNNRILRTGTEAIQLGQLGGINRVYNNVFWGAVDWRASFQAFQDNNFQIGIRTGELLIHHNIFIGAAGSMLSTFSHDISGDDASANVGIHIHDNVFLAMRNLGMYLNNTSLPNMTFRLENNAFGGWRFERDEVYTDATPYTHLLRLANSSSPIELVNNTWQGPSDLCNSLQNNGMQGNVTATGNVNEAPTMPRFVDSGVPADIDYLTIEMWTDVATRGTDQPVVYDQGDIVTHHDGMVYTCALDPCPAGQAPPDHPNTWTPRAPFPDDVRVAPNTHWEGLGPVASPQP